MVYAGDVAFQDGVGQLVLVQLQAVCSVGGRSNPHLSFVQMHTADFQTFSGKLVIKVKVSGLLVIAVDFILFSDEKGLFVIYAVYISLQQGGESLGGEIELGYSFRTEQVDFSVTVAGHAQHGVAEKAVRVVLLQLVSLYVFSVITVQAFSGSNP